MTGLVLLLIIIVNFILESTIIHYFNIFGVVPNTALIVTVIIALLKGKNVGSIVGLISGLLQDIIFSPVIGINGFILFFTGFLIGFMEGKLSKDNILIPIMLTLISTIGYHLLYSLFLYFLAYNIPIIAFFKEVVLFEMVYNGVISVLVFKGFSKIFIIPPIRFGKR